MRAKQLYPKSLSAPRVVIICTGRALFRVADRPSHSPYDNPDDVLSRIRNESQSITRHASQLLRCRRHGAYVTASRTCLPKEWEELMVRERSHACLVAAARGVREA